MKTTAVKGKPGIRMKENGKFIVTKYIQGKRTTKEFTSLKDAVKWKRDTFDFDLTVNGKDPTAENDSPASTVYFRDVYLQYLEEGMVELEPNTIHRKKLRMAKFMPNLFHVPMSELNGRVILKHIEDMKLTVPENSRRCNFDKELKDLSSILRWYDEEITPFPLPIKRKHFAAGKIKDVPRKNKNLPTDVLPIAGIHMRKSIRYLTVMQFLLGCRVGEVAALNDRTVDFKNKIINLSEAIVWHKGKPTHKYGTKTDVPNVKEMTPLMEEILLEMKNERPKGCKYFFQFKGKPFRYDMIRKELNQALEKAGFGDFTGTHILRYSMSSFARREEGLDVAQAMLAHADARMTESYAKLDVNKKVTGVVIKAESIFRNKIATKSQPNDNQDEKDVI